MKETSIQWVSATGGQKKAAFTAQPNITTQVLVPDVCVWSSDTQMN